jgi:hypothetical protein
VVQAQLEALPAQFNLPEVQTPRIIPRVHLIVTPTYSQNRDAFGLSRSYKGVPSAIPDNPTALSFIPGYFHPKPNRKSRPIEEIISPYPNLSSFLLDHYFWTSGPSKSRNNQDAMQALITHPNFDPDNLVGVNFHRIEEELRGHSSRGNWEQQRGWMKSKIHVGIPTGQKQTALVW